MENVLFCSILAVETFHVKRLIVIKTIFSNRFTCSQRISWESKTIFSNQFTYSLKRCLATSYERHSLSISATREVGFSFISCHCLTHFMPVVSFYTSWKHQKTRGFLMLPGGLEKDQWHWVGQCHNNCYECLNTLRYFQ